MVTTGNEMLGRIRRALGHAARLVPPEPSSLCTASPALSLSKPVENTDLVALFCAELEKVGGRASRVTSSAELKKYFERILTPGIPTLVAVSDVVATLQEELLKTLELDGARFLRPLDLPEQPLAAHAAEIENYRRELAAASVGVTTADYAIADTGTLVLLSGGERHRLISLLPPVHICLLDSQCLFPSLMSLLLHLKKHFYAGELPPQATTFITGPSRTADIEQTLTTGVHGPYSLEVLLY